MNMPNTKKKETNTNKCKNNKTKRKKRNVYNINEIPKTYPNLSHAIN